MTADNQFPRGTIEYWRDESWRLFGYALGGDRNHNTVAEALSMIDAILQLNGDVEIKVERKPDRKAVERTQSALAEEGIIAGERFAEHLMNHPVLSQSAKSEPNDQNGEVENNAD